MSMRDSSRKEWSGNETIERINAGSLQRIADATELMAKNHAALIADADYYKRRCSSLEDDIACIERSRAAYKAWVTRLKRIAYPPQFTDESVGFEGTENDRGKN